MYTCECGREFEKKQSFCAHCGHCKVHLREDEYNKRYPSKEPIDDSSSVLDRKRRLNDFLDIWISDEHRCEECGKVMIEFYGSGRFCSRECAACNSERYIKSLSLTGYDLSDTRLCECGQIFKNSQSYRAHCRNCLEHLGDRFDPDKHSCKNSISYESRAWSKGKDKTDPEYGNSLRKPNILDKILNNEVPCQSNRLKYYLYKYGLKEWVCEKCNKSEYDGEAIPLELHHIDGNKNNNKLDNIQFLCPTCHARTDTYRWKNTRKNIDTIETKSSYKSDSVIEENVTISVEDSAERIQKIDEFVNSSIEMFLKICPTRKSREDAVSLIERLGIISKLSIRELTSK